ncbi:hypothetical protein MOD96_01745 [Bacillus sp. S17B2]|uniref:hypothetical protein n=1 Tax=Bacillus sp. S17B2 TaxID=2918907 RepID=UPI002281FDF9|nr:hypothetical protein [Bacillus sp. S17B2]
MAIGGFSKLNQMQRYGDRSEKMPDLIGGWDKKTFNKAKDVLKDVEESYVEYFEFHDSCVDVTVLRGSPVVIGTQKFQLSYQEFNQYIKPGITKSKSEDSELGFLSDFVGDSGAYHLPVGTYEVEKIAEGLLIRVRVGDPNWGLVSVYEAEVRSGGITRIPCEADIGSVYVVEWLLNGNIVYEENAPRVNSVKKFIGSFFPLRTDQDFVDVPFLCDKLNRDIQNNWLNGGNKKKWLKRWVAGVDSMLAVATKEDMQNEGYRSEILRSIAQKTQIDWSKVRR